MGAAFPRTFPLIAVFAMVKNTMRPLLFRVLRFSAVIAALFGASLSYAQTAGHWNWIRIDTPEVSAFFRNRDYGIVGFNTTAPGCLISRTTNAGNSWMNITNLPTYLLSVPNTGLSTGKVPSIFMRDSLTMWFTFVQNNLQYPLTPLQNGIYNSTDGGLSWEDLEDSAQWNTVVESSPGVLATSTGGIAFQDSLNGIASAASSPLNGLNYANSTESTTTDGGRTWQPLPFSSIGYWESWNIYCHKETGTYIFYQDAVTAGSTTGMISSDFGQTWRGFHLNNIDCADSNQTTGGITGAGDAIYVQTPECGIYRSTDDGNTWVSVGGPSNSDDTKLFAPSVCKGSVVIASGIFDTSTYQTGIWMTTDGGDGTIPLPDDTLTIQPGIFDTISSCDSSLTPIVFGNCGCTPADYHFDSAIFVGDTRFSITNTSLFPTAWNGFASRDSLFIEFAPRHQSGLATGVVHLYGRIIRDSTVTSFDSIITVQQYALSTPNLQTTLSHNASTFDLGSVSICTGSDTVLQIRNNGCSPVTITAEEIAASGFEVTQLTLPLTLPVDSTITLHVHTQPSDTIPEQGTVTLHVSSDSLTELLTVQLQADGSWGGGNLTATPSPAQFSPSSLCGSDSVMLTLVNTGCDSLILTSASILANLGSAGDSDFTFSGSLPDTIGENDTAHVTLIFHPSGLGQRSAWVDLHAHDAHGNQTERDLEVEMNGNGTARTPAVTLSTPSLNFGSVSTCGQSVTLPVVLSSTGCDTLTCSSAVPALPFAVTKSFSSALPVGVSDTALITFTPTATGQFNDTLTITTNAGTETVPLQGVGIAGAKVLSVDTSLRDFGALYACQSRDTTIVLRNTGCDTLTVDSGYVTNGSYATDANYPIILPPDSSETVQVSLAADSAGMNGSLEFFSNANQGNSTVTIPLTASIIPPAHLVLALSPSDTATAGSIVRCYVILEGQVPSGAISGLNFDITHNDDLLSYVNASGVTMTGTSGTPELQTLQFTLDHPPPPPSIGGGVDTLGSISFQAYLSDSSSTPLTLSNVTFTNSLSLSDNCIASIVDSGASFTYLYSCGEPLIQDGMLGTLPFVITSIQPNPAHDEITIRVDAADPGSIGGGDDAAGGGSIHAVHCEMYDALGRGQDVRSTSLQSGILLDVSGVPSGIYFIRLSMGGYVQSRSVVVQH